VDLREVAFTIARSVATDDGVWRRIQQLIIPPLGVAAVVVGARGCCLSFARPGEEVNWNFVELEGWVGRMTAPQGDVLVTRAASFLGGAGQPPDRGAAVGSFRLLGSTAVGGVPAIDRVAHQIRDLYLRSQAEALALRHAPGDLLFRSCEQRARRRLIGLELNERLMSL
jgi:hypothetical protein